MTDYRWNVEPVRRGRIAAKNIVRISGSKGESKSYISCSSSFIKQNLKLLLVHQEITDKAALSSQFVFKNNKNLVSFNRGGGGGAMALSTMSTKQ
jgi:hypothetical protein